MYTFIIIFDIILACSVKYVVSNPSIEFAAPNLMNKSVPYKLIITNDIPGSKFPVDSFAFVLELLSSVSPRTEISVADVSSNTYTGDEYRGFSIKNCVFKTDTIEMTVEFRREAHGAIFRVRFASPKTDTEKEAFYVKKPNTGVLFTRSITMRLPYTITILVSPDIRIVSQQDRESMGPAVLPKLIGQISCQASDGLPNAYPKFINSEILVGSSVNTISNDAVKLVWMVTILDHGKSLQCQAGQDINSTIINVYHYMTNVMTNPPIDKIVTQGSRTKCMGKDGFPLPKTEWIFLSGPPDSRKFYELQDNDATLWINYTAPINSNWAFECRGVHYMPQVVTKYLKTQSPYYPMRRTYNFTIVEPEKPDVKLSNAGVIITVFMVLLSSVVLIIFGYKYRENIRNFVNDRILGREQPIKMVQKPTANNYTYNEVRKSPPTYNGKDDNLVYSEIVATVQMKSPLGPIDRV